jgi:hypothetical protein
VRLVNYGPGEIVDRLTILALKILYGGQASKPVEHFEQERNVLLTQLRGRELNGAWFEQAIALGALNGALWRAEDELRVLRHQSPEVRAQWTGFVGQTWVDEVARLAVRIQVLNDQRAVLIEAINKLTGDHQGSEKL